MIDRAIEKINMEMQKNAADPYTEILGHYIIDRCNNDVAAAKVAADGKTLKGAMDAVMKKASAAKRGNVAVLPPSAVFGAVDEYFGFPTDMQAQQAAMMAADGGAQPAAPGRVALDLADFF